jgi:hypothetical protein
VKEWHTPEGAALPVPPGLFFLALPEEEHDTSYFALSPSIKSFSVMSMVHRRV